MDRFEALYIINKSTKKYKSLGEKRHQQRTKALYKLKHRLIQEWVDEFEEIHIHHINGTDYYYFQKDDFGYHAPQSEVKLFNRQPSEHKKLTDFQNTVVNESNRTEREALEYIRQNFGYNPNHFLPQDHTPNAEWGFI